VCSPKNSPCPKYGTDLNRTPLTWTYHALSRTNRAICFGLHHPKLDTLDVSERREWRRWLQANHGTEKAIWLQFYKKHTDEAGISYEDAIEEALAFGWIDGMVRRIDDQRYRLRFTPRRSGSVWSKLNIARVEKLLREGKMTKHGMVAFERRTDKASLAEQFKVDEPPVPKDFLAALERNKRASENFSRFAPSYGRRHFMWLTSAGTPETREKNQGSCGPDSPKHREPTEVRQD
jgi:uncharacterized protein YdeI (YjbR/CyaY-like superfamily)